MKAKKLVIKKKETKDKQVAARIHADVYKALKQLAKDNDVSLSELVSYILTIGLQARGYLDR